MRTQLLAMIGFAAVAATPVLANPSCLELGRIYNWKVVDNKTLIVEDDIHQKFRMSLMGYCPNLFFKERIGFKSVGGTDLSCLGPGDEVLVRDVAIPGRCPITKVEPYTPAMEQTDKAAAAAKDQQKSNP